MIKIRVKRIVVQKEKINIIIIIIIFGEDNGSPIYVNILKGLGRLGLRFELLY